MRRPKEYTVLIIMIAGIIVFLAIGVLMIHSRINQDESSSNSTSQSSDNNSDTALKTYTNNRFGFKFDYSQDFTDPKNINLTNTQANSSSDYFSLSLKDGASLVFNAKPLANDEINLSLDELVSRHSANFQKKVTGSLGNENAIRLSFKQGTISLGGVRTDVKGYDVMFVRHNNTLTWVEIKPSATDTQKDQDLFNALLASFTFTSPSTPPPAPSPGPAPTPGTPGPAPAPTPDPTPVSQVQSFTISADDSAATPSEITVPAGTIVDLTFNVSGTNVYSGGLDFRSTVVNSGTIYAGTSKTIAFTANKSFSIAAYAPGSNIAKGYTIKVTVQ